MRLPFFFDDEVAIIGKNGDELNGWEICNVSPRLFKISPGSWSRLSLVMSQYIGEKYASQTKQVAGLTTQFPCSISYKFSVDW